MDILVYAVVLIVLVTPCVLVHETGHFLAARLCGIRVQQFIVGAGPRVFMREGRGGTNYAICALPLGAFCGVDRMNYKESPPAHRLCFSLAGSSANFIFAGMLLIPIGLLDDPITTIVEVSEGPALETGLRTGDRIVAVDGNDTERWSEVGVALVSRVGDTGTIDLAVVRDDRLMSFAVPIVDWQSDAHQIESLAALGVKRGNGQSMASNPLSRLVYGVEDTFTAGIATAGAGIKMIVGDLSILNFGGALWLGMLGEDDTSLLTSENRQALSWTTWLRVFALLSIGLGVINLLPGPIVDGRAIICSTLELTLRRPISERLDKAILYVGSVFAYGPLVICIFYEVHAVF